MSSAVDDCRAARRTLIYPGHEYREELDVCTKWSGQPTHRGTHCRFFVRRSANGRIQLSYWTPRQSARNEPTIPTTLAEGMPLIAYDICLTRFAQQYNPFMRVELPSLARAVGLSADPVDAVAVMAAVRKAKDNWTPKTT